MLTCEDFGPHPVGEDYIMYRYSVDGVPTVGWTTYTEPIYFPEESHHELEYYCVDLLGNQEETNVADFYVDHTKPVMDLYHDPVKVLGGNSPKRDIYASLLNYEFMN